MEGRERQSCLGPLLSGLTSFLTVVAAVLEELWTHHPRLNHKAWKAAHREDHSDEWLGDTPSQSLFKLFLPNGNPS